MTELEKKIKEAIQKTLVVANKESIEKYAVPEIIKVLNNELRKI